MKYRISLVEDDSIMRNLLKTLLEMEGYEVLSFEGASDSLTAALKKFSPHFVLMDYHLKNVTGVDLLRLIRSVLQHPSPLILILSGEDHKDRSAAEMGRRAA